MALDEEIKQNRLKKLKALQTAGILVYPGQSRRTHPCAEALKKFSSLARSKSELVLAGRMLALRQHGAIAFACIEDGSASIQLMFKKDGLGDKSYRFFLDHFDVGDFVEARGVLFKTQKGEKTLQVADYKMLAKSLLPLPEKWHGLQDIEERYRKRYLDLIFNPEVKKKFEMRSTMIREIRSFLEKEGFLEVETPILQPLYGGAKAKPFVTHLNALDLDLYLRISPELYLKRLLVGGFEKVYELGKCFRNEGMDKTHNPDFTMLEFYWAYADYKDLMQFTEKMFSVILKKMFGSLKITKEGKEIDFTPPWPRIEFPQLLKKYAKIDFEDMNKTALEKEAKKLSIVPEGEKAEIADQIYKKVCRPKIWNPTFIIHHPLGAFPLAKSLDQNPLKTANFQVVAGYTELINAFSELNDPLEQRKRFEEQERIFKKGFSEAQRLDEDFIAALEYGMPPAAGFGMGIDRLVALLTDSHAVREVILFPVMRPEGQ